MSVRDGKSHVRAILPKIRVTRLSILIMTFCWFKEFRFLYRPFHASIPHVWSGFELQFSSYKKTPLQIVGSSSDETNLPKFIFVYRISRALISNIIPSLLNSYSISNEFLIGSAVSNVISTLDIYRDILQIWSNFLITIYVKTKLTAD